MVWQREPSFRRLVPDPDSVADAGFLHRGQKRNMRPCQRHSSRFCLDSRFDSRWIFFYLPDHSLRYLLAPPLFPGAAFSATLAQRDFPVLAKNRPVPSVRRAAKNLSSSQRKIAHSFTPMLKNLSQSGKITFFVKKFSTPLDLQ